MPVVLNNSGHAHKTVLGATDGQSRHSVIEMRSAIIINLTMSPQHGRAHQNLSFDIGIIFGVTLGEDTTK